VNPLAVIDWSSRITHITNTSFANPYRVPYNALITCASAPPFPNSLVSHNLKFGDLHLHTNLETSLYDQVPVRQLQPIQHGAIAFCNTSIKTYRFGLDSGICLFVALALSFVSILRYTAGIKLGIYTSSRRGLSRVVPSLLSAILLCGSCLQGAEAADLSVTVNPSSGFDSSSCNMTSPCRTIAHAIQSRNANVLFLASGTFVESSVAINSSIPFVNITGLLGGTVFDCSLSTSSGPAFAVTNTSIAISKS
jgi:hypothetical protein